MCVYILQSSQLSYTRHNFQWKQDKWSQANRKLDRRRKQYVNHCWEAVGSSSSSTLVGQLGSGSWCWKANVENRGWPSLNTRSLMPINRWIDFCRLRNLPQSTSADAHYECKIGHQWWPILVCCWCRCLKMHKSGLGDTIGLIVVVVSFFPILFVSELSRLLLREVA